MSRAFVKESDGDDAVVLPELQISPHRNLVTPRGMTLIRDRVAALEAELSEARTREDRAAMARIQREGRVSYVSPIAQALLGVQVGDEVEMGARAVEAVDIR